MFLISSRFTRLTEQKTCHCNFYPVDRLIPTHGNDKTAVKIGDSTIDISDDNENTVKIKVGHKLVGAKETG